jgi:hypothetical protein
MTTITSNTTRDRVAATLDSERRLPFLAKLAWEMVISNRASYPDPTTDQYRQAEPSICLNEILHALTSQIWSDVDKVSWGFPDRALFEVMVSKSRAWRCEATCRDALRASIRRFVSATIAPDTNGLAITIEKGIELRGSDRRPAFLADLLYRLTDAARAISLPSTPELTPYTDALRCMNRLLFHVAEQVRTDVENGGVARNDTGFVQSLIAIANEGRCGGDLRYAFERTLVGIEPRG